MIGPVAAVLAHQGGWDELALVGTPVGLFAGLLFVANRKAAKLADEESEDTSPASPPATGPAPRRGRQR